MERVKSNIDPCVLVIFGASGDLTTRKLIPALYSLDSENGLLPDSLQIVGVARSDFDDEEFRDKLCEGVDKFGRLKPDQWSAFAQRLSYLQGEYDDAETYSRLKARLEKIDQEQNTNGNHLFYLAIPPNVYPTVIEHLGASGLNHNGNGWTRIIVEKPFGNDLSSAQHLNDLVHASFDETQVYRIDHYLGKETVQNILTFRFANLIFEELWNRNYVDHVQITALEEEGVGHRAGYYDQSGVLRDMVQNHLLQLLALTALEPPSQMNAKALRDEKVKVLQAVRPIAISNTVWGQYEGYRAEEGVAPDSRTPTYTALQLYIDNWRWEGVPFFLRSGKNVKNKSTEITLHFKHAPHSIFGPKADPPANHLSICIQPDEGMHLRFGLKQPGADMVTEPVAMNFHYADLIGQRALPDAYERLLLDALAGDASLFTRSDEIERAWELITPLLQGWDQGGGVELLTYSPGSWGPAAANELIKPFGPWETCCAERHKNNHGC